MSIAQAVEEDLTLFPLVISAGAIVEPAEVYEQTFVAPVQRLNHSLTDVLDADSHPDRTPDEAMALLRDALDTFQEETATWR